MVDSHSLLGRTVSHYRIIEKLGSGGMGVVYRAYDERLRRRVAWQLLTDRISSHSERWSRILAEARVASALFIAMEPLPGKALRGEMQEGPVESRKRCG
jgi:serine/threonine protein kinase